VNCILLSDENCDEVPMAPCQIELAYQFSGWVGRPALSGFSGQL